MSITFVLFLCIWGSGKSRTKISHMSTKGYLKGPSQYLGVLRFQPKSCGFSSNYSVAQCGANTSWTKQEYNFFHYSPPSLAFPVFSLWTTMTGHPSSMTPSGKTAWIKQDLGEWTPASALNDPAVRSTRPHVLHAGSEDPIIGLFLPFFFLMIDSSQRQNYFGVY